MEFASEVTDKKHLPAGCCCSLLGGPNSYEQRMRLQRACIAASAAGSYTLSNITVTHGGNGYGEGTYLQINYGNPSLLVFVSAVNGSGGILSVTVINNPTFTQPPPVTEISGSIIGELPGSGALFLITAIKNSASCCVCGC